MKKIFLIKICLLSFVTFSQKINENYKSFSENNSSEHLLNFVNDSVVQFSSIRTHMSGQVILEGKFKKTRDTIFIYAPNFSAKEYTEAKMYKIDYLENKIIKLQINKTELIDNENKTVYVKNSIYLKNYYLRKSLSYFEGKKYIIDRGIISGYGTYVKTPRKNKKFLKTIEKKIKNPNNYKSTIFRGLTAYKKFGLIGINGVVVTEKI